MRAIRAAPAMIAAALIVVLAAWGPVGVQRVAAAGSNAVTDWALISQNAVIVGRPAGSGFYLQAIVLVAINDAVAAVDGGTRPLVGSPPVSRPADADAAVATAARDVLVARVPGQAATVQLAYDAYLAGITDGAAKTNGIAVGHAAATVVLADRADDNFDVDPPYVQPTPGPGVFEPVLPTKPVDIKMGDVKPIVLPNAEDFLPGPPPALASEEYALDFAEVKALGRKTGSTRTPQQTETALFWSENTVVQFNRTFRELAMERGLSRAETARLLTMTFVSGADSVIVCLRAKYRYMLWRPVHAIQRADTDGNPATEPDPEWQSLLVVNHPEYPSGHACITGAVVPALDAYFGTDRDPITVSSTVTGTSRTYPSFKAMGRDVFMARIYGGLHYRFTMGEGFNLARHVARYVISHAFE